MAQGLDLAKYPVLVVDDESDNLDAFRFNFGRTFKLLLAGSGEHFTAPVRIKGSTLVLYFEPPAEDAEPLSLVPGGRGAQEAMIDVEQASLGAFEQDLFACLARLDQEPGRICDEWTHLGGVA